MKTMITSKTWIVGFVSICATSMLVGGSDPESETAKLKSTDSTIDQYKSDAFRRMLRIGPMMIGIVPPVVYHTEPLSGVPFYYPQGKPNPRESNNPFLYARQSSHLHLRRMY